MNDEEKPCCACGGPGPHFDIASCIAWSQKTMTTQPSPPTTAAAEHEGPIEWTGPDGFKKRMRVFLAEADNVGGLATADTLIDALTANPQLRAAVLARLPEFQHDGEGAFAAALVDTEEKLRAAESELTTLRADNSSLLRSGTLRIGQLEAELTEAKADYNRMFVEYDRVAGELAAERARVRELGPLLEMEPFVRTMAKEPGPLPYLRTIRAAVVRLDALRSPQQPAPTPALSEQCFCEHSWGDHVTGHGCTARLDDKSECECGKSPPALSEQVAPKHTCRPDDLSQYCAGCDADYEAEMDAYKAPRSYKRSDEVVLPPVESKPWPQVGDLVTLASASSADTRSALRDSRGLGIDIGFTGRVMSLDADCCSLYDPDGHEWTVSIRDLRPAGNEVPPPVEPADDSGRCSQSHDGMRCVHESGHQLPHVYRAAERTIRNHTEGLVLRLLSEIADDVAKGHYLNGAHKAAELQLTLLRLLSEVLKK